MNPQKLIFPGLALGIILLIMAVVLLSPVGRGHVQSAVPAGPVANPEDCSVSAAYPDSIRQWCGTIERYAVENGLDPNLISAIILRESSGKPDAYSKSGAVGLMQVMPRDGLAAKFMCPNGPCFTNRPSMQELFDPEYNVAYGSRMLAQLIQSTGDVREALKAYGPMDAGYTYADLVLSTFNSRQ